MLRERESNKGHIVHLEEEDALLRQRLFGRKSEQTADLATPQLALFNEAEIIAKPVCEDAEEEVVAPSKRRGKRKPLPADLPRIEVIHELPEHELTCVCGCRKHAIGEEVSEQLEIVPMQIRVIKHIRKVYGCRDCETAPVTADKPAQLIEMLEGYRGYVMTDDYAGYNALVAQSGVERLGCWAHARRKFVEAQKVQPKGKTGCADIALNLINKL